MRRNKKKSIPLQSRTFLALFNFSSVDNFSINLRTISKIYLYFVSFVLIQNAKCKDDSDCDEKKNEFYQQSEGQTTKINRQTNVKSTQTPKKRRRRNVTKNEIYTK